MFLLLVSAGRRCAAEAAGSSHHGQLGASTCVTGPGGRQSGKTPRWREVADVAIDNTQEPNASWLVMILYRLHAAYRLLRKVGNVPHSSVLFSFSRFVHG